VAGPVAGGAGNIIPAMTDGAARSRFSIGPMPGRRELLWLGVIVAAYVVVALVVIRGGGPLGHDESVYALRARDFHSGTPAAGFYWEDYRAPGLPWLSQFVWLVGSSAPYLRLVTAGFMVVLVVLTWLAGRALFEPAVGLVAAAGLAATPFMVEASVQVWPDVPGAALGLGAVLVLLFATSGDRASWWVLAVPVLVAAATYVRFGAPLQMLVGLGAVGLYRWRVVRRAPAAVAIAAAASTAAVWVILAVPAASGSALSPMEALGRRRRRWFEGFFDYPEQAGDIVGSVAGFLLVAGVLAAVVAVWQGRGRSDPARRAALAVLGAGAGTVAVTALVLHGELRYLSPTMPWLWVAAGVGLVPVLRSVPDAAAPAVAGALALTLVVSAVAEGNEQSDLSAERFNTVVDASQAIAGLAAGRACGVVTGFTPQVAWYSGCRTGWYDLQRVALPDAMVEASDVVYLMWVQEGKRQPDPGLWDEYVSASAGLVHREEGRRVVEVYAAGD